RHLRERRGGALVRAGLPGGPGRRARGRHSRPHRRLDRGGARRGRAGAGRRTARVAPQYPEYPVRSAASSVSSSPRNSHAAPSAWSAIWPWSVVHSVPALTSVPLTQIVTLRPRHSITISFHSPGGFSEPSVRLRIRR